MYVANYFSNLFRTDSRGDKLDRRGVPGANRLTEHRQTLHFSRDILFILPVRSGNNYL